MGVSKVSERGLRSNPTSLFNSSSPTQQFSNTHRTVKERFQSRQVSSTEISRISLAINATRLHGGHYHKMTQADDKI